MGLSKEITLPTGVTVSYWRINAIDVDLEANYTKVRLGGYASKLDALMRKKPHTDIHYNFRGSENPIVMNANPTSWKPSLEDKIRGSDIDESETELERVQRLSLTGISGMLYGATVVSDLPD